jgi:hypothetical protein
MGNNTSNQNINENTTCLICWDNIDDKKWTKCIYCNILLHISCEERYRGSKGYCECPHCRRIGTIGVIYDLKN